MEFLLCIANMWSDFLFIGAGFYTIAFIGVLVSMFLISKHRTITTAIIVLISGGASELGKIILKMGVMLGIFRVVLQMF